LNSRKELKDIKTENEKKDKTNEINKENNNL
jgi:hypothetical protein